MLYRRIVFTVSLLMLFCSSILLYPQDDLWDMNLDSILQEETANSDEEVEDVATSTNWDLKVIDESFFFFPSDSYLNPGDVFPLDLFTNMGSLRFTYGANISNYLLFNLDLFGGLSYGVNDKKDWDKEISKDWQIYELYFAYFPQNLNWLAFEIGRKNLAFGNSYAFEIYNSFMYSKDNLKNRESSKTGTNVAAIKIIKKSFDIGLFYVPGGVTAVSSDVLRLDNPASLVLASNFYMDKVNANAFLFGNSDFDWSAGIGASIEVGTHSVLYSDFLTGTVDVMQKEQESEIMPGFFNYSDSIENRQIYKGVLGLNLSLESFPDIITELYFNSAGINKKDWDNYVEYIQLISSTGYFSSPMGAYYKGLLGNEISKYDPFEYARWLLYFRIYDYLGESDNWEWAVNTFFSLQDYSALLSPELIWNVNPAWYLKIKCNFYVGSDDTVFGILPYWGDVQMKIEFSLNN